MVVVTSGRAASRRTVHVPRAKLCDLRTILSLGFKQHGIRRGVQVIDPGSLPGLKPGMVILSLDGKPTHDVTELSTLLWSMVDWSDRGRPSPPASGDDGDACELGLCGKWAAPPPARCVFDSDDEEEDSDCCTSLASGCALVEIVVQDPSGARGDEVTLQKGWTVAHAGDGKLSFEFDAFDDQASAPDDEDDDDGYDDGVFNGTLSFTSGAAGAEALIEGQLFGYDSVNFTLVELQRWPRSRIVHLNGAGPIDSAAAFHRAWRSGGDNRLGIERTDPLRPRAPPLLREGRQWGRG